MDRRGECHDAEEAVSEKCVDMKIFSLCLGPSASRSLTPERSYISYLIDSVVAYMKLYNAISTLSNSAHGARRNPRPPARLLGPLSAAVLRRWLMISPFLS